MDFIKLFTVLLIIYTALTLAASPPDTVVTGDAEAKELNLLGRRAMTGIALSRIAHQIIPLRKQPRRWIVNVPIKPLVADYAPVQNNIKLPELLVYSFESLTSVKDQGDCGACWAFALVDTLIDRQTVPRKPAEVSAQYLLDCYKPDGCNGGHPEDAALYFLQTRKPIPKASENGYRQRKGGEPRQVCRPWTYATIASVVRITEFTVDDPDILAQNILNMKRELNTNGPFYAAMEIYDDFRDYKGLEPYTPRPGAQLIGGHAVEVVGYVDNDKRYNVPYWVCKNSWGNQWPIESELKGIFMIESGRNVCLIEAMCGYATAVLEDGGMSAQRASDL